MVCIFEEGHNNSCSASLTIPLRNLSNHFSRLLKLSHNGDVSYMLVRWQRHHAKGSYIAWIEVENLLQKYCCPTGICSYIIQNLILFNNPLLSLKGRDVDHFPRWFVCLLLYWKQARLIELIWKIKNILFLLLWNIYLYNKYILW